MFIEYSGKLKLNNFQFFKKRIKSLCNNRLLRTIELVNYKLIDKINTNIQGGW